MINFNFLAKSGPTFLIGGGILFILLDGIMGTNFGLIGPVLLALGILLNLIWAGIFKKIF